MSVLYRLNFSPTILPIEKNAVIYRNKTKTGNNPAQFYSFSNDSLSKYEFNQNTALWQNKWSKSLKFDDPTKKRIICFPTIENTDNIVMVKTSRGINFYQLQEYGLNLMLRSEDYNENTFHDVFGWNEPNNIIKAGHFYRVGASIGVLTKHQEYGLQFYIMNQDSLLSKNYPLWSVQTDLSLIGNYSSADIFLADIANKGQQNIIFRNRDGLNVYEFDENLDLKRIQKVADGAKSEDTEQNLYFPNLTGKSFRDIVVFNKTGMFIYHYDNQRRNYTALHYNSLFSEFKGWTNELARSVIFEDINSDGFEEMICKGPRGIDILSFDRDTNQWFSYLDDNQLTIPERYGEIKTVFPVNSANYPMLFTYTDQLHWANIITIENNFEPEEANTPKATSTASLPQQLIPQVAQHQLMTENPVRLLRDDLDCSPILNAVDKVTGKANFQLPLIDLTSAFSNNIKVNLIYNGLSQESTTMGVGWSGLPQSYITVDYQSGIYEELESYYLISDSLTTQLKLDHDNSTPTTYLFKPSNNITSDIQIRYHKPEEKWEIKKANITEIYGCSSICLTKHPITWQIVWENWRGIGSSPTGQIKIPTSWYLTEVRDENKIMKFAYDISEERIPDSTNSFTREIYLKSITSQTTTNLNKYEINFEYSSKDSNEYDAPAIMDKNKIIRQQLIISKYLKGYTVTTPNYHQKINFNYKNINGIRLLTEISQENDPLMKPTLHFDYKLLSNSYLLEKAILPSEAQIEFHYEAIGKVSSTQQQLGDIRLDVPTNSKIDFINGDIIVTSINAGEITFKTFKHDDRSASIIHHSLGQKKAQTYETTSMTNYFAVVVYYTTKKELHLFNKPDKTWMKTTDFTFSIDAQIEFGKDFILAFEKYSPVQMLNWDKDSKTWLKQVFQTNFPLDHNSKSLSQVAISGNTFVVYNNNIFWIAYKDHQQKWRSKKLKDMAGAMDCVKTTIDKFNLENEPSKQLLDQFEQNALQMHNNLFLLSRWCVKGSQLYTMLDLFALNKNYEIIKQQQFDIPHEDLSQLEVSKDLKFNVNEGNPPHPVDKIYKLKLGYDLSEAKFRIILKEFPTSFLTDTRKSVEDQISGAPQQEITKAIENQKIEFKKYSEKLYEKYSLLTGAQILQNIPVLNYQTVVISDKTIIFTGNEWKEQTEKNKFNFFTLGNKYIVAKQNENSSIKLYEGTNEKKLDKSLVDLGTTEFNDVYSAYPTYLVYQEKSSSTLKLIKFTKNGEYDTIISLPPNEQMNSFSNQQTLISNIGNSTLVFRQMNGLSQFLPNHVITKVLSYFSFNNSDKRTSGFEYKLPKSLNNAIFYQESSFIPGNDRASFGWTTEERYFNKPLEAQKIKFFNGQGNLIKTLPLKPEPNEVDNSTSVDLAKLYSNTTIFDTTGKFKVAEFFTNDITDEEVGYYGFEEYEENKIGSKNQGQKWIFNENDVVENGFSLTGQNYLRLSQSILYGTFMPKQQNEDYIASCWLRPHNETIIESSITSFLTANIQLEHDGQIYEYTRLGEVKYQVGNWYYVEVLVDFASAKDMPKFNTKPTSPEGQNKQLKTSIVVQPSRHSKVDIDHIRFSPLNNPFKATVYNINTMQIKEEICHDGLFKRHIYNKHNKEIALIDEYGKIKEFKTYTKASSIGKIVPLNSITQFEPETGFHESFSPYSFEKRWKVDTTDAWQISPNQLSHISPTEHDLLLNLNGIDPKSFGIRMYLTLYDKHDSFLKFGNRVTLKSNGKIAEAVFSEITSLMPLNSEVIIVLENTRLFVWIDGGLYFDRSVPEALINSIKVSGQVKLNDVMVFNKPSIQTIYSNSIQEKLQKIQLENEHTAIIKEYLYDELGRQTISTQPARIVRSSDQSLLIYQPNFVSNKNPYSEDSIWKTGLLKGECKDLLGEYGYSQTKYFDNPLNDKKITGLPGKEFSIYGPYAKRFSPFTENIYINNAYPANRNYTYQVEYMPGEVKHITVLDKKKNKAAKFIEIPNSKDILSTYEYDSKGNVIKILPPLYHERVQSLIQLYSLPLKNVTVEPNSLEKSSCIFITYNKNDDILTKETPDSQKIEHIYDKDLLKLTIYYNQDNNPENVMYFDYDKFGRLYERGELTQQYSRQQLLNLTLAQNNTKIYQQFNYNDFERNPILRRKYKRVITYNEGNPIIEEFTFTANEKTLSKGILIQIKGDENPQMMEVNKLYAAEKEMEIDYPVNIQGKPFKLTYKYDKLGHMIGIGVPGNENLFAQFTYNSFGQITTEDYAPNSDKIFTRQYSYNSAGYLTQIQDKFLKEDISYTDKSYGGTGYGDGTITSTKFEAKWHLSKHCNNNLKLNKDSFIGPGITPYESELCFNKLKEAKYLDSNDHQAKVFYPKLNQELPIACTYGVGSQHIQKILGTKGFPSHYGHSYDYGNHQELTKAKYFIGDEMPLPLQPDTFSKEIPTLNSTTSQDIWQKLYAAGYIIQNKEKADFSQGHSRPGKSIIRSNLFNDLGDISTNYRHYEQPLQRILVSCLAEKQKPEQIKSSLQNAIHKWIYYMDEKSIKKVSSDILNMLEKKSYLTNPFTEEFNTILKNYQSHIPEIVCVLQEHFGSQLGEAEFDVESYDIDANGNHKLFYTGFDRYNLNYKGNTNQISSIEYISFSSIEGFKNFDLKHDNRGNVIQALHKGIKMIEYHPVSNRPIKMNLVDGRSLLFQYDMQGERILKKVINNNGEPIYEIYYIRDESGKTLVEKKLTYTLPNLLPDVLITTYIYGPRGLVGFYRHDEFYNVFSDHEGSIRLVINGDEVVAAYDYLPYGNMMRKYVNNPESHISYLYTGEEFDEETSLYNLHARFYDPSIGRFYQMDPREQYFSPYKYAGNSPVSMIDPNGEFGWLIAIFKVVVKVVSFIAPVIFGYIGGVKANNNQVNPLKWDFLKASTWSGIVGGVKRGTSLAVQVVEDPLKFLPAIGSAIKAVKAENATPKSFLNQLITAAEGFAVNYENPKKISGANIDKIGSNILTQNGFSTDSDIYEKNKFFNGMIDVVKSNSEIPKNGKSISQILPANSKNSVDKTIFDITGQTQSFPLLNNKWNIQSQTPFDISQTQPIQLSNFNTNRAWNSPKHAMFDTLPPPKIQTPNFNLYKSGIRFKREDRSSSQNWGKLAQHKNLNWVKNLTNQMDENKSREKIRRTRSTAGVIKHQGDQQRSQFNINKSSNDRIGLLTLRPMDLKSHKPKLISSDMISGSKEQPIVDVQVETSLETLGIYKALQFVANFMEQYKHELENFEQNSWNFKYYNETVQEILKIKSKLNKAVWADISRNEAVAAFSSNQLSDTVSYHHEIQYDYVLLKGYSSSNQTKVSHNTNEGNRLKSQAQTKVSHNTNEENHLKSQAQSFSTSNKEPFIEKLLNTSSTRSTKEISYIAIYNIPQLNFSQPIPIELQKDVLHECHQCKYITYGVVLSDFEANKINEIPERQKQLPQSSRNSKITTFHDLVGSNQLSDKKRQKRSISYQPTNHHENYFRLDYEREASRVNQSTHIKKTAAIANQGANTGSGWMNWFSWFRNSANGFFNPNEEIPNDTSSNPKLSQVEAQFDTNGTILLLDILVRKATGKKFVLSKQDDELSILEMQGIAISITSEFENILNNAAVKSGVPLENLTFDPIKVQQIIIDQIRAGKFSKISQTLYSYAKEAHSNSEHNDAFLINLKKQLEKSFNMRKKAKPMRIHEKQPALARIREVKGKFMNVSDEMTANFLNKSNVMLIN